ncbi:MAG TPA: glycosyltransferase family 4 protein [Blastocatellia bacterium]|nr:glycosyltransferase family 4 protein [Blastocatellia bacterium]
MKILYLTAGAAGMYCGSCLRDNALASELIRQGHDVTLVPLYTPTLTDEPNVSHDRIFFGGISVYLQQHSRLFRKTPWMVDRLWDSLFALKLAARSSIQVDPKALGELTVSMLRGEEGNQRKELQKMIHWLGSEPPPDIIVLPFSLLIGLAKPLKKALNRPVLCTLQGEDLFLEGLHEPYRTESLDLIRSQVGVVDGFIAVSDFYADFMTDYLRIPEEKMHVVPLGINLEGYEPKPRERRDVFTIGYFARVAPEKGLHLLCEAYRLLRERSDFAGARIEVAGYLGPEHREYMRHIEEQMKDWGLGDEFHYRGAVDRNEKTAFLQSIDVLSVPATYDEPKGIFLLEAMANGSPVVQPRRGGFTEIVESTGGGLLVEPDNPHSLAEGLYSMYKNPSIAREMGERGAEGVRKLYNVARMAERALDVYSSYVVAPERRSAEITPAEVA